MDNLSVTSTHSARITHTLMDLQTAQHARKTNLQYSHIHHLYATPPGIGDRKSMPERYCHGPRPRVESDFVITTLPPPSLALTLISVRMNCHKTHDICMDRGVRLTFEAGAV